MNILVECILWNILGEIYVEGEECRFKDIKESEAKGIAIIHQELALVPTLSIAENVFRK